MVSVFIGVYLESGWRLLQISTVAEREQFTICLLIFAIPAIACDSPAATGRKFMSVIARRQKSRKAEKQKSRKPGRTGKTEKSSRASKSSSKLSKKKGAGVEQ